MEPLIIKATDDTPNVNFDKNKGHFEISGKSMPEDVLAFYSPLINWLKKYNEDPNELTEFILKMDYFNTASSKLLLDVLMAVEELAQQEKKVCVKWFYKANDEEMKEAGEEYADIVELNFEYISF